MDIKNSGDSSLLLISDLEQVIHRDDEMFEFDNKPKPVNTAVDTINKQVIDISDAVEVEESTTEDEQKTNEVNNDVVVSPEIAEKADKFYKGMSHAKAN